jgi:hypothetical protein
MLCFYYNKEQQRCNAYFKRVGTAWKWRGDLNRKARGLIKVLSHEISMLKEPRQWNFLLVTSLNLQNGISVTTVKIALQYNDRIDR